MQKEINKSPKTLVKKAINKAVLVVTLMTIAGCSMNGYKNSWDCKKAKGIGCTSVEYADSQARQNILLNSKKQEIGKVKLAEGYEDFIYKPERELEVE